MRASNRSKFLFVIPNTAQDLEELSRIFIQTELILVLEYHNNQLAPKNMIERNAFLACLFLTFVA